MLSKASQQQLKKFRLSSSKISTKKTTKKDRSAVNQSIDLGVLSSLHKKTGVLALKREGKIREIFNMTDLQDNRLENELIETMKQASTQEKRRINNVSVNTAQDDRCPNRYHLSSKGPDMKAILMQSLDIDAKKASGAPDRFH